MLPLCLYLLSIYRAKFLCFIAVLAIYHSKCWNVPCMPVLLSLSYKNKEISVFIKTFDTYSVFFPFQDLQLLQNRVSISELLMPILPKWSAQWRNVLIINSSYQYYLRCPIQVPYKIIRYLTGTFLVEVLSYCITFCNE